MANLIYDSGRAGVLAGTIVYGTDVIKVRLVPATYTPNVATDTTMTPVGAGIGTDQTLGTKSVGNDTVNHFAFWKAASALFSAVAAGSTVAGAVVYKFVTNDAASIPILYVALTSTPTNGGDVTVAWASDANGGLWKVA